MPIHWPGAPAQDKKEMKHISERCCSESPKAEACPVHWERPTSSQYTGNTQPGSQYTGNAQLVLSTLFFTGFHTPALYTGNTQPVLSTLLFTLGTPNLFSHTVLYPWNTQPVLSTLLFTLEMPNHFSQHTVVYTGNTQLVLSTLLSTLKTPNWFSVHCSLITGSAVCFSAYYSLYKENIQLDTRSLSKRK